MPMLLSAPDHEETTLMPLNVSIPYSLRIAICALAGSFVLSGCSVDLERDPAPTAAPTAITFGPDDVAVGELLDRSRSAWSTLEGWSSEARTEQLDASESGAGSTVTVEQVQLPSKRRVLSSTGETVVSEELAIDGTIYMRGSLVTSSIYPDVDPDTWIVFTPDNVPADTPLAQRVRYLTGEPAFPFNSVTAATRALPASPVGEIQVNDRTCSVYQFRTERDPSSGITYRIAFADNWLPCQFVAEGGGIVETTTWDYDVSTFSISAPDVAVPVDTFPNAP